MSAGRVRLLSLTTSFPTSTNPASGVFIHRLLESMPAGISTVVVTPAGTVRQSVTGPHRIKVVAFRYAPRSHQVLAHQPGGLPAAGRRRRFLIYLPMLCGAAFAAALCRARRADILHAHWAPAGIIAGLAGRLTGRPVVTTLWGTDVRWAERWPFFRFVLGAALLLSHRVVAVSRDMQKQVGRWFPGCRHKVVVIHNGVAVPARRASLSSEGFLVGVIGNLVAGKRVDDVIRAFGELVRRYPFTRLLVVGDGPERIKLQSWCEKLGLQGKVVFTGRVPPDRVCRYLSRCRVLVLASESEGRPNIVLEAMAAGVPVVAAGIPAVQEMVKHGRNGLLFPVGDWRSLAKQLDALLDDPALGKRLAQAAARWLDDRRLTWETTASHYANLYRLVIAEHRNGKTPWPPS